MFQVISQSPPSSNTKHTFIDGKYPGISLLSPANMSLATRKYMQKYGLVYMDRNDDDEDKENGIFLLLALYLWWQ